ncbi:MAG: low molecular weight phosphotyrosine protein phosphatase [Proteobacteria bacterium]|nr:low molecular weight phosphotyrosine protein phosphatase [Pseudomonadota bacterium]
MVHAVTARPPGAAGVLFVCMGNICRSPTAEGVFRARVERAGLAQRIVVDSAGTHDYHVGEPPDRRAIAAAARRGYDLSGLRARLVEPQDFDRFDWILAMDGRNLAALGAMRPASYAGTLTRMLALAPELGLRDVPDPYYGPRAGFEQVLDLVEAAATSVLAHLRAAGSAP